MAIGIKPQDVQTSQPVNPLKVADNRVVSPTLGGAGSVSTFNVEQPTAALNPFVERTVRVPSTKTGDVTTV
jgi:hypothetical protein